MTTNAPGTSARLFPWQVKHYIQRGGPNDPVAQASGGPPVSTGGSLGWNTSLTFPPIPGTQTPPAVPLPRVMSMTSAGTYTTTTGILATNTGGILVGTIPGGSWIDGIEIYTYAVLAGTSSFPTSVGLFYTNANAFNTVAQPQPVTLWALGTTPANPVAGTTYTSYGAAANTITTVGCLRAALASYQVGPGNGVAGSTQLASLGPPEGQGFGGLTQGAASLPSGDIDLYFVAFTVAGSATSTLTGGEFGFRIDFTGQEG
jgi:hypothetical protein